MGKNYTVQQEPKLQYFVSCSMYGWPEFFMTKYNTSSRRTLGRGVSQLKIAGHDLALSEL